MIINLFSADLKLVQADDPEKRGFKVLEFNDGLRSGFKGFDALENGNMISGRVVPDYKELFPDHRIIDLNETSVVEDKGPKILMPRSDNLPTMFGRMLLVTAHRMSSVYTTMNSDIHMTALTNSKAYQYFIQTQMNKDAAEGIFPPSLILPTEFKPAQDDISQAKNCDEGYVLKPVNSLGGTGVRLIEPDKLSKDLERFFKFHGRAHKNWPGKWESACVLQDRISTNAVETDDGIFDGTMRVAFTIYGDKETGFQCKVHDAYWKLPLEPVGEGTTLENVVSYSPSNMEEKSNPLAKILRNVFGGLAEGTKGMHAHAVDDNVKAWLFPQLAEHLGSYFSFAQKASHLENTAALLNSKSVGHQALGVMMLTDPSYYPHEDAPDLHYPKRLVDAAKDSLAAREGVPFITRIFRARVNISEHRMLCENTRGEFIDPLRSLLETPNLTTMAFMMTMRGMK